MKRIHNFSYFSLLLEKNQVDPIPENLYAEETVAPLPFSDEIKDNKEEFLKKINYIAKELGIKPEWLMIAIHNESGFDPHVSNPSSGATGLIQFMPSTIVDYIHPERKTSMTTADLKDMDSIEQLDVVYEYLKQVPSSAPSPTPAPKSPTIPSPPCTPIWAWCAWLPSKALWSPMSPA
jgi:hypothetical protein